MNNEDFKVVVDGCIENIKQVLDSKSQEYSSADDKLHNFVAAAKLMRCKSKEFALLGMLNKHLVSVVDMILKYEQEGVLPSAKLVNEKIGDSINYFILLKACFMEDIYVEENDRCKKESGWTVDDIRSFRNRIEKIDKLEDDTKFICKDCANRKTCNEIGIIQRNNEATRCTAFKAKTVEKNPDKWIKARKEIERYEAQKPADINEIWKRQQEAMANSMCFNPRKIAVVAGMRRRLKPIFVYLTENNRFGDYEIIKGICNKEEMKKDEIDDDEFYEDIVVALEQLKYSDDMISVRDKIINEIAEGLSKFNVGDSVFCIGQNAWNNMWKTFCQFKINRINISIEDRKIIYGDEHGMISSEKDCFKTEGEAQRECDNRNNTNTMK